MQIFFRIRLFLAFMIMGHVAISQDTLGKIKCPVLVMAGEKDQNAPLKAVIAAYEMIPNAQLSIIPMPRILYSWQISRLCGRVCSLSWIGTPNKSLETIL